MADFVCPRGHLSDDADFCSECGLRIAAAPAPPPAAASAGPAPASGEPCPDCGTPRVAGARFCEVCRRDFSAAPTRPAPARSPPPPPVALAAALPPIETVAPISGNVWVIVARDPDRAPAEAGASEPERAYPLDLAENLVGRRHGRRDLHPEIPVADPSVSARHLKICRRPDGALYVVDVGSSNGTLLNGAALSEGVEAPLAPGDCLAIGEHTLLRLEER